jgi:hypothetical protein
MPFSDHLQSKYLKAADLPAPRLRVTISEFETHEVGQPKESKLVCFFEEFDKPLILNKTNTKTLLKLFGDDEQAACGKPVDLVVRDVDYNGETHPAIRITAPTPLAPRQVRAATPQPPDVP